MTDPTESTRRHLLAEINAAPGSREYLEHEHGQVWDTGQLQDDFEVLGFMARSVAEWGQTIVMVTHDPVAASYADRVVFLADGRIVDELPNPTPQRVLDAMKNLGEE